MKNIRKWWAFALPTVLSLSACAPTTEAPPGIVSTSLCGDTYTLASGSDIAALSWQSDGPLSTVSGGYIKASADLETLAALQPGILLLGPGETIREEVLGDTTIIRLDWTEDWDGVQVNADKLASAGLPAMPEITRPMNAPRMLYLSRAGGTAGPGTYVDEVIRRAGAINLVEQPGWFTPDPEWVVSQEPDIIVTSFNDAYESINAPLARNRAVAAFVASHMVIDVPGKFWPCAGPGLAEAVELISEGLR